MSAVRQWLETIGLAQYGDAFEANDIDMDLLKQIDDQALRELGMSSTGHRLRLRNAIAKLGSTITADAKADTVGVGPATPERRQLTVMFCDLVGSTALSAQLDPEDMREVILAYQAACSGVMPTYDGFVAKFMGDGVLTYFGYPRAHEDDPERAVRAGLDIVAAVGRIKTRSGDPLQVRIGIATGLVVVGDLVGEGASQEQAVVGDTPNLAARLQGIAEPNTVVIADGTRRLLGHLFELQDLGARHMKGIAGPTRAWAALRPRPIESRFEALHATGLTALVGREEETELLLRRWSRAKTGEGQVVLISGEAGIGKSRLTAALMERLATEPHTRLRYFCSPQHTDSALHPFRDQMERAASLMHDDPPQTKLDKFDALFARTSTPRGDAGLLADALSLANDGRYPALELTPPQRRQRILSALVSQLVALTATNPMLMIFEDAHWADATSLELLGVLVNRITSLPVLLLVTFRPEFAAPWIGRAHVTVLTMNRLGQSEIGALIDRVAGNKLLPPDVRHDIAERTDGVPLFIEEMTKAVLESEGDAQRATPATPLSARSVPATLHASLMARLDRLGPAKDVAQVGAAIGREFCHPLLAAVVRKPEAELHSALDRLVASGLVFRQGLPPHASYLFKHALVQDAAYVTLLREPRRSLHRRIAEMIETRFPEIAESQPELLAYHCTEAGLIEKAAGLWGKAGLRSLERSALVEAADQLTRALGQFAALPSTSRLRREQIKLQVALTSALMHTKGQSARETRASLDQSHAFIESAEALGESPEDPLLLFSVLYGFWIASFSAFNGDVIRDLAAQFLALAERQKANVPLMLGHRIMGISLTCTGDIAEGRSHLDLAIALYDPVQHHRLATQFGVDSWVSALSFRSLALWLLGYPEAAIGDANDAMKSAREIGHAATLMLALAHTSSTYVRCGCYAAAKAQLDELVALADEKGSLFWKAAATVHQGCILGLTGKAADSIQVMSAGIVAWRSTGATAWTPWWSSHLASAYAAVGQFDASWQCVGEAMTLVATNNDRPWEAEVHRKAGEITLMSPERDLARAQSYFDRALTVAQAQQAKSWELRAAMSMARLWRDQGKRQQAYDLLAPVYGWFTEGFDTLDLKQAKALLDELAT